MRSSCDEPFGSPKLIFKAWFRFLIQHRIKFQIRLHLDPLVRNGRRKFLRAGRLFASTRSSQLPIVPEARRMWGLKVYLSSCRLRHGDYPILVLPEYLPGPATEYQRRSASKLSSAHLNLAASIRKIPESRTPKGPAV